MNGGIINSAKVLLDLIRFPNLVFLSFLQALVFALYIRESAVPMISPSFYFWTCLLPTLCILSFGNVGNDYIDKDSDLINQKRPFGLGKISESHLFTAFLFTTVLSVISAIVSALMLHSILCFAIFVLIILLLFAYSLRLKCIPFLGNFLIAFLGALAVFFPFIIYRINRYSFEINREEKLFLAFFCGFIIIFSLLREIVKDTEDRKGDLERNCKTAVVRFGIETANVVIFVLSALIGIGFVIWIIYSSFNLSILISVFGVVPFLVLVILLFKQADYGKISLYIKAEMVIASLLLIFQKML